MSARLPDSPKAWRSQIASENLTDKSILELNTYDSGSKIKHEQFLLLRAYCVSIERETFEEQHLARWFPYHNKAMRILSSKDAEDLGWQKYLQSFDDPAYKTSLPRFHNLRSFSIVRYYQRAVDHVDLEQVSQKTRYFTRSMSKLSETRREDPSTPIRSSSTHLNTRREEFPTPVRSSSTHLHRDIDEFLDDMDINTPASKMSAYDASDATEMAKLLAPTEDEQIVNTALILFLTTVTMHFTDKVHWSLQRKAFHVRAGMNKAFEARVDGILRKGYGESDDVLAILEVKPCARQQNKVSIQRQEAAQIACWISSQWRSLTDSQVSGKSRRQKRMLISQDRHEIWLTLAEYDDSYVEYIRDGTIPKTETGDEEQGLLRLEVVGPFDTQTAKYMRNLGHYILAFVLEHCNGTM